MPLDLEMQASDTRCKDRQEYFRMLILTVLTIAVLITFLFIGGEPDTHPSPSRIALRIHHNINSAHLWARDFSRDEPSHDLKDIRLMFDRAEGYATVALDGGEIDGVSIAPLECPQLRQEMEEISKAIGPLGKDTLEFLSRRVDAERAAEFDRLYENRFVELKSMMTQFKSDSLDFFQRHRSRFHALQIILIILAMGFVLAILVTSKKAHTEKSEALGLVEQIEKRRELAIEGANLGTWDWDIVSGTIIFNKRWVEMLGLEPETVEPNYETWEKLVHPEDLPRVLRELEDHLAGKTDRLFSEYRMWAQPDRWIWVLDMGKVLERDADGKPVRAAGTHLDITDRKTAEFESRSEKERAQKYLDLAGVVFVALDGQGVVTMINRKGCQILGLPEDYVVGRNWMENFVPIRYRSQTRVVARDLLDEGGENSSCFVNPVLTASGAEVLISWQNTTLHDDEGNVVGHLSSGTDITDQRNHETAVKKYQRRLQSLAARIAFTEDRLRQDIASGLHDSIGQNLAALKLSMDLVGLNLAHEENLDMAEVQKDLRQASETVDKIVQETWSMSFQLCPPGLYESGIGSALEWLVTRFNEKYNCEFRLTTHKHPLPREKDGRGLLFQMVRELMINAVKHGAAKEVKVSLSGADSFILVTVADNGIGFDTEGALAEDGDVGGFGLFSIRERLAYIAGQLEIESTLGQGTRVVIRYPVGDIAFSETETADEDQDFAG